MKKRLKTILSLIVSFSVILSAVLGVNFSAEAKADIGFYAASVLETVKQDADVKDYKVLNSLKMSGAKGETEGAQFFINSGADLSDFDLFATQLKNGDSVISVENIDIYVEIYTKAIDSVLFVGTNGAGIYPDCLIPIEYIKQAGENFVEAGNNQGFWIDVEIPIDAKAGVYNGEVIFTASDVEKIIPLSVEVFDFVMPEAPGLATCYLIWDEWLLDAEFDNTTAKHWDYYNTLLDYNISGYEFPSETPEDFVDAMVEYFDKVNMFGVPYRAISKTDNDWEYYLSYMIAIGEKCKEDGVNYFEKAYYYFDMFYDEATSFDWRIEQMRTIIETTDSYEDYIIERLVEEGTIIDSTDCAVAQSIRGLQHAITTESYMHDTWEGVLDMYVQHTNGLTTTADIEKYETLLADDNYTIWGYTTELCDYPNPAVNIPSIPVTARDVYWFDYEVGITGELYWCVNNNVNCNSVSGLRYSPIYDPYTNAAHEGVSNGGGYYLYPGMHYGSDKPFPSIRLAVKRDGIDDYTYMTELENRYEKVGKSDSVKQIISFINQLIIKSGRSMINEQGLFVARENLARLIEAYDTFGLVVEKLNYTDSGIEILATADSGVTVSIEGSSITCQKGALQKTITFETKKALTVVNGFEDSNDISVLGVQTNYGSSVSSNYLVKYNGLKSAKVVLSGYVNFDNPNHVLTYKPSFYIDLSSLGLTNGLKDCTGVSFYVYNSGNDRSFEVYVQSKTGSVTSTKTYDRVILKSHTWTKIEIDNFNMISLNENDYSGVYRIGLRTDNMYLNNASYSQTLYVDDIAVGRK